MSHTPRRAGPSLLLLLATIATAGTMSKDGPNALDQYNVVWTSPSANSGESMPCGGGDIGLNVWVEEGELLFYIGQAGCRDENGALLKHGRVRVQRPPAGAGGGARQAL